MKDELKPLKHYLSCRTRSALIRTKILEHKMYSKTELQKILAENIPRLIRGISNSPTDGFRNYGVACYNEIEAFLGFRTERDVYVDVKRKRFYSRQGQKTTIEHAGFRITIETHNE